MTLYNVHLYREMRLFFPAIEAGTAGEAARLAEAKPTGEAEYTEDCEGESLAALIDLVGDDGFSRSVIIDFEPERRRKAAMELFEALDYLLEQTVDMDLKHGVALTEGEADAREKALAAIAKASETGCRPTYHQTPQRNNEEE
jgi:hypothetical protein